MPEPDVDDPPRRGAIARRVGLFWGGSLLVLGLGAWLTCPGGQCAVGALDRFGLALAHGWRAAGLDAWLLGVTWLGSLVVLLPLAVLVAVRQAWLGQKAAAVFVPLAVLGAAALAHLAKLWVLRPRPDLYPALVSMPADWSYPSAHTLQATAFALALYLVAGRRARTWAVPLVLAVVLVGYSRIHLQVHYPSDVLFGAIAAGLWVAGLHALILRPGLHRRRAGTVTEGA